MRETNTHIYFFGDDDIYSNFYHVEEGFNYKGKTFYNSEQAFMWEKANMFNDTITASKILKETKPYECKKLGRKVKNYDDNKWSLVREDLWYNILMSKFSTSELKDKILATDKVLVEASPFDAIYGVKLSETDDRILDESKWRGQNLLGKILMRVREDLK